MLPRWLVQYKSSLKFPVSHNKFRDLPQCRGSTVVLHGYLGNRSDVSKSTSFAPLLDISLQTSLQIISSPQAGQQQQTDVHARFKSLAANTPVVVTGIVQPKIQPKKPSTSHAGDFDRVTEIEINLKDIKPLNEFPEDVKIAEGDLIKPQNRHLQLKFTKSLRDALLFRSKVAQFCRHKLTAEHGFLEIETPLLFKSTPEGAREFLVPTRSKGFMYALPQSPQQYKQILMASGIPRYFQVAKCFRDEDLRADRQPEFSQIDIEMAFASGEDVMDVTESLIRYLWAEMVPDSSLGTEPFARISYSDAMQRYGSDKPDTRLGMEIFRIDHLLPPDLISKIGPLPFPAVDVMNFRVTEDPKKARSFIESFMTSPEAISFVENPAGQPGIFIIDPKKPVQGLQAFGFEAADYLQEVLGLTTGNIVIIQAREDAPFTGGSTPIGNLRLALHRAAVKHGLIKTPAGYDFLWVTGFPLFSPSNDTDPGQTGTAGLMSTHHPFTAPYGPEDVDILIGAEDDESSAAYLEAKADHYDLVVNGVELGGGSRRIHSAEFQEYVLRKVLRLDNERIKDFAHLLEVLRAGCPPHAGIALGFDRLVAVMLGKESIRDVIAFPKTGRGEDPLVKSPSQLTKEQLEIYHLKLVS